MLDSLITGMNDRNVALMISMMDHLFKVLNRRYAYSVLLMSKQKYLITEQLNLVTGHMQRYVLPHTGHHIW